MARTEEFSKGRIHGCCQKGTMEHLTTCHYCPPDSPTVRGEVMYDAGVGEPLCKNCAKDVNRHRDWDAEGDGGKPDPIRPWTEH